MLGGCALEGRKMQQPWKLSSAQGHDFHVLWVRTTVI
jgi:hypothetical protein